MTKDENKKAYLKGYEAGLKEAWSDISRLTTRGYSSTELNIMAKSKMAVVSRAVEEKARALEGSDLTIGEVSAPGGAGRLPEKRGSYVVKEEKAEAVFDHFASLLEKGHRGLCITRTHPRELGERFDSKTVRFVWLSRSAGEGRMDVKSVSPTELSSLASQAVDFMEKEKNSAVLLEGIEYLVSQNGFPPVLKFVQMLSEKSVLHDSYLLLSVNPEAMSEKEYRQIAKEMAGEI